MTKLDACQHNWQPYEKIWAIIHRMVEFPGNVADCKYTAGSFSRIIMPVGIREITVTEVKKWDAYPYINMTITFDIDDPEIIESDKRIVLNKVFPGGEEHYAFNIPDDCKSKFFDKADAEAELKKQYKEFAQILEKYDSVILNDMHAISNEIQKLESEHDKMSKVRADIASILVDVPGSTYQNTQKSC